MRRPIHIARPTERSSSKLLIIGRCIVCCVIFGWYFSYKMIVSVRPSLTTTDVIIVDNELIGSGNRLQGDEQSLQDIGEHITSTVTRSRQDKQTTSGKKTATTNNRNSSSMIDEFYGNFNESQTLARNLNKESKIRSKNRWFWKLFLNSTCLKNLVTLSPSVAEFCPDRSHPCRDLTCANLLTDSGPANIYQTAREFMKENARKFNKVVDDTKLGELARMNCSEFRQLGGYHSRPLSELEANFPIAFTILVHENAVQIERLLRAIYRPQNIYCLHIDLNAPAYFHQALSSIASCFENVFLASKMEIISWAGFNRLQADLNCMKDLIASGVQWKYLINTAGQAFPLKTNEEIVKILTIYNGANDIEGMHGERVIRDRFEPEWQELLESRIVVKTGRLNPPPPHAIDIVRGSAYGVFSYDFVRYVLEDKHAIDLLDWSRSTYSPDEHYWATLHHTYNNPHLKTPGSYSGYPNDKPWLAVYANWNESTCHGQSIHEVCVFGVEDLPLLLLRRELFANKFYIDSEPLALECLSDWIRHKELCPILLDEKFYSALPFIKPKRKFIGLSNSQKGRG